jgi:hypothetical protein
MREIALFLVFKRNLEIVLIEKITPTFFVNGELFSQKSSNDFNGFYDWLRDETEEIIGIRYDLFEDFAFLRNYISTLDYVNMQDNLALQITFAGKLKFCEQMSDDKLFTDDYIYLSDLGNYGITFSLPEANNIFSSEATSKFEILKKLRKNEQLP